MSSTIQRYFTKQLFSGIAIVLFALLGIDIFFYLVNELRYLGKGQYSIFMLLFFVALKVPTKLYFLFPWSALLGTLLTLGQLSKNNELVVLQSSGMSVAKQALIVLRAALLVTLLMLIIGEVVSPVTESLAQKKKMSAISSGKAMQIKDGVWVRNKDSFIYVKQSSSANNLKDLTIYNFDDDLHLKVAMHANQAEKNDEGWHLHGVSGTRFYKDRIESFIKQKLDVKHLVDIDVLEATSVKHLERLSFKQLLKIITVRSGNNLDVQDYVFSFWLKVFHPVGALVMVLLAVPFAFGPLRSSSMGARLLVGVLIGFTFYISNTVIAPMVTVVEMSPFLAASIPSILFVGIAMWLLNVTARVK